MNKNEEILEILEEKQPKVITVKLKGIKDTFWKDQWVNIAHEKDEKSTKFDENIYFYVDNDVNFNDLKVGDTLELDEDFEIWRLKMDKNEEKHTTRCKDCLKKIYKENKNEHDL